MTSYLHILAISYLLKTIICYGNIVNQRTFHKDMNTIKSNLECCYRKTVSGVGNLGKLSKIKTVKHMEKTLYFLGGIKCFSYTSVTFLFFPLVRPKILLKFHKGKK